MRFGTQPQFVDQYYKGSNSKAVEQLLGHDYISVTNILQDKSATGPEVIPQFTWNWSNVFHIDWSLKQSRKALQTVWEGKAWCLIPEILIGCFKEFSNKLLDRSSLSFETPFPTVFLSFTNYCTRENVWKWCHLSPFVQLIKDIQRLQSSYM